MYSESDALSTLPWPTLPSNVYACYAGFVREVPKDSERDFTIKGKK